MSKIKLEQYVPQIATYVILVPENYLIEDDNESGILSITEPNGISSMTISSYSVEGNIDELVTRNFFADMTEGYSPISEIQYLSEPHHILAQKFIKGNRHWTWWVNVLGSKIIVASVNSEKELITEDSGLYWFIIERLEIIDDSND